MSNSVNVNSSSAHTRKSNKTLSLHSSIFGVRTFQMSLDVINLLTGWSLCGWRTGLGLFSWTRKLVARIMSHSHYCLYVYSSRRDVCWRISGLLAKLYRMNAEVKKKKQKTSTSLLTNTPYVHTGNPLMCKSALFRKSNNWYESHYHNIVSTSAFALRHCSHFVPLSRRSYVGGNFYGIYHWCQWLVANAMF